MAKSVTFPVSEAQQQEIKIMPHQIQLITIVHNLLWRYTVILYVGRNWKITGNWLEITYKSSEKYKKYLTLIVFYATM